MVVWSAEGAGGEVGGWSWWCVLLAVADVGVGWVGRGRERGEPERGLRVGGLEAVEVAWGGRERVRMRVAGGARPRS